MNFNTEDYNRMLIHPLTVLKSKDILKDYPILKHYAIFDSELSPSLNRNKIFAYMALIWDTNSPLQIVTDIIRKKSEASIICGFEMANNGKMQSEYMGIIECRNEVVNAMCIQYGRLQRSEDWVEYCIYLDKFYNLCIQLQNETKPDQEKIIMQNIKVNKDARAKVYSDFTLNDFNKALKNQIIDEIELEQIALRPENIALKMLNGEEPVNIKPYGSKYTFEKYSKDDE